MLRAGFNPNCEFRLRKEAGVFEVFARIGIKAGAPCCRAACRVAARLTRCGRRLLYASGEEACISYGEDLTNQELTDRYGFTLANNPNGEAPKPFRDKYTDSLYSSPTAAS